ncbi:putative reverse transcriptase domain-containing protein [Tanacetum coccineum]
MKIGHLARDCRSYGPNGNNNNRGNFGTTQNVVTCYECGVQGHFKKDCPKLKNGNRGNQHRNGNAPAKVYVVGNAGTNLDSNVVTGTFLLNDRYASILFDTGIDRSFISTTFSSLIDITPTTLDHYYDVELDDGKIIGINTIIRGCTLNFLDHPFNVNLMLVELGSFDVIIGMDWLSKYHALIDCAKKIEVDHVSESNDEQPIDDFEILQTKLNNMDEQAFDNELGTEGDKKDGENRYSIDSPKKKMEEDTNFNSTNSETKDNSSDLSRPPGFEFMKKSFSSSSNCSTSFARRRKNDIKGFSLLSELNQIIDVGSSLGYDVRGCKKTLNKMIKGIGIHMVDK